MWNLSKPDKKLLTKPEFVSWLRKQIDIRLQAPPPKEGETTLGFEPEELEAGKEILRYLTGDQGRFDSFADYQWKRYQQTHYRPLILLHRDERYGKREIVWAFQWANFVPEFLCLRPEQERDEPSTKLVIEQLVNDLNGIKLPELGTNLKEDSGEGD